MTPRGQVIERLDSTLETTPIPTKAVRFRRLRACGRKRYRWPYCPSIPRDFGQVESGLLDVMRELVMGRAPWPFYLCGPPGRGKTCAMLALVDRVPGALYRIARYYIEGWNLDAGSYPWRESRDAPLLVIDEVGVDEEKFGRGRSALTRLADIRQYRPTVWISNHTPDGLRSLYDDRLVSRICGGAAYHLGGPDRRDTKWRRGSETDSESEVNR